MRMKLRQIDVIVGQFTQRGQIYLILSEINFSH
jgi:hypothetical protein